MQRVTVALLTSLVVLLAVAVLQDRAAEAQAVPKVLRAEAIEVVDARGEVRAQLNIEQGGAIFRLRDQTGTIRVKLGGDVNGSGLLLADATTQPGVHILATRARTFVMLQRGAKKRVLRP